MNYPTDTTSCLACKTAYRIRENETDRYNRVCALCKSRLFIADEFLSFSRTFHGGTDCDVVVTWHWNLEDGTTECSACVVPIEFPASFRTKPKIITLPSFVPTDITNITLEIGE